MAGTKKIDEHDFRAMLGDSLQEIQVSDRLREKTLAACSQWLMEHPEGVVPDGMGQLEASAITEGSVNLEAEMPRLRLFLTRYMGPIRVVASLAACLVIVLILKDLWPGMMRSSSPGAESPMMGASRMESAADASGASPMESETASSFFTESMKDSGDLQNEGDAGFGIMAESDGLEDGEAAAGEEEMPMVSILEAGPIDPEVFSWSMGSWSAPVGLKPSETILTQMLETYFPGSSSIELLNGGPFPVEHLEEPLTKEIVMAASSWDQLIGTSGIWMVPYAEGSARYLVPATMNIPGAESEQPFPLYLMNTDEWLDLLSDPVRIQQTLTRESGKTVDTWTVVDVQNGLGYLVCWTHDGRDWVMPLMDMPEVLGLENGAAYTWEAFQTIVVDSF